MLLTSTQVSVAISSSIVVMCTLALFLAGYTLQQQTVRSLQAMIVKPTLVPQSQYLDLASGRKIAAAPEKNDAGYERTLKLERHRLRRGKALDPSLLKGVGANGGKVGGYRSDTTPERFRGGRKQVDENLPLMEKQGQAVLENDMKRYEDEVEMADNDGEGGISVAPWAKTGGLTNENDPTDNKYNLQDQKVRSF